MKRALNFNAGPAALPEEVLTKAQSEWLNIRNSGMSVMELSHRSSIFEDIHNSAIHSLKEILQIPSNYEVLFLQGGASLQFSMVPMNLNAPDKFADYVITGSWSEKALKEAQKVGKTRIAGSGKKDNYTHIPKPDEILVSNDASYLHITSNNTIYGTQWREYPDTKHVPLAADMSSDILSKEIEVDKFGLIYAGAQKNLGPSGVTAVIIRKDLIHESSHIPSMLSYYIHAKNNSLYNTPPTFAIYLLSLVLEWVKDKGGLKKIEAINTKKANLIYKAIDESDGFYKGHARSGSRSNMNITFTLPEEDAEKQFLKQAAEAGFTGLNGHRSIGGCRASIYNAVPYSHCEQLFDFMKAFKNTYKKCCTR
ncbi:phosphoserine aminotransferase apoenzyme [Bacillus sp. OV322]|uniref:3-phosphoserine/phosphohydroxythreonine transaminase n=1 Tax=Bacillus sp. OV322 TaxID=1882764 RepID=UPI0008E013F9|nr:3-phosphoserine/phosphohydroxythreonine transaminase [Bacillus sp. OV322]SFB95644.1 phosphoserine aminotransferase apoenzyme [Bacillus sp. OV322]